MPEQLVFSVTESSQVGEVRRAARKLAEQSGLSENRQSSAAIIATELATNIVSHAGQGQVLLGVANGVGSVCLDILACDSGPGMVDVQRCLQDGYSTSGTPGNGLGAVRRLADEFDLFSNRDQGTVVMARLYAGSPAKQLPPVVQFAISTPVAGETVCGDAWRSSFVGAQFALMVVDGLGHGRGAHEAATRAVESFESGPSASPEQLLDSAHRALYGSRGAALAVAKVDFHTQRLSFAGVGNISGLLITTAGSKGLTSHNGILGAQKPRIQQFEYEWTSPALLILHSDGLQTRWRLDKYPGLPQRHPGVVAGVLYRDFLRGHDDATIAVARLSQNGRVRTKAFAVMSSDALSPSPQAAPGHEVTELRRELEEAQARIRILTDELAETNQGVVALYAELDDHAERLRQASDLKSRFLSYLSHEFRTPLNSIRSVARLLLDHMDGPLTGEQEKQIGFMQSAAVELTEMVNDLLDLAKVEAGRITVSPEWFEMVDLFTALRGMFKPIANNEAVSLVFVEAGGLPALYSDDQKLSQILRNLISNALKFTRTGEVRVAARMVSPEVVEFSVQDTGIGIPAEYLQAIFQDYVQVTSSIQKKLRGTGLGLALSRKLAQLLGGELTVESQIGVGSTFFVSIPVRLPESACPPDDVKLG